MIRKIYRLSIQVDEIHVEDESDADEVVSSMPTEGMPRQLVYMTADLQTREGLGSAIAGARDTVEEELLGREPAPEEGDDL